MKSVQSDPRWLTKSQPKGAVDIYFQKIKLLPHPRHRRSRLDGRYLESAVKMMGRDKEGVDAAMAGFMSMLEDEKDSVPALLGMSLAFTLEGSPNKVFPQINTAILLLVVQPCFMVLALVKVFPS